MDNVDETKPKTKSIRVVKMAELHTDYPIVSEGRKWVNYGEGNEYPEYLLDLFLYSPTNSAVIGATSQMIVGSGLQVENQEGNPIAANAVSNYFSLKKLKKLAFNLKTYELPKATISPIISWPSIRGAGSVRLPLMV